MVDENFIEPVHNLTPTGSVGPGTEGGGPHAPRTTGIVGRVIAVHRRRATPSAEPHVLDVTIGAEEYTEIVLRVPTRPYAHMEGKRAILYVQEQPE